MFERGLRLGVVVLPGIVWGCGDDAAVRGDIDVTPVNLSASVPAGGPRPIAMGGVNPPAGFSGFGHLPPSIMIGRIEGAAPHQIAKSPLTVRTASLEVLATCSFEDSVRCVDLKGKRVPEYEKKLTQHFAEVEERGGYSAVPFRIGLKNRAMFFKSHHSGGPFEPRWVTYGAPPKQRNHPSALDGQANMIEGGPQDEVWLTFLAVPKSEETGRVSGLLRQPLRTTKGFKLAVDEVIDIDQHQLKIIGIDKRERGWFVRFKLIKTTPSEIGLNLRLNDSSGRLVEYSDRNGRPLDTAEAKELLAEYAKREAGEFASTRPVIGVGEIALTRKEGTNLFEAALSVDPGQVFQATLSGEMRVLYEIRGIPLAK